MSDTKQQCPHGKTQQEGCIECSNDEYADSPVEGGEPTSSGSEQAQPSASGFAGLASGEAVRIGIPTMSESSLPDSPSAGSGARETLDNLLCLVGEHVSDYGFNGAMYHYHWEDSAKAEQVLHDYADHCTAPLREQLNSALKDGFNTTAQLVTERSRREAAERERDAHRELIRRLLEDELIHGQNVPSCKIIEDMSAALRGKGESNGN